MCRIGVFLVPQIKKFVAELRKSVTFTVEQRLSNSVSFETQLTSDIDVIKTEIKKIPLQKLFGLLNVDILKKYVKTIRMIPNFYTMSKHLEIRIRFPSKLFNTSEEFSQLFLYHSIRNNFLNPNLLNLILEDSKTSFQELSSRQDFLQSNSTIRRQNVCRQF